MYHFLLILLTSFFSLSSSRLLSKRYSILNAEERSRLPASFYLTINGERNMLTIEIVSENGKWAGVGFGALKMKNTLAYVYSRNPDTNEMEVSIMRLGDHKPGKKLGRVDNWSVSVRNGVTVLSFQRRFQEFRHFTFTHQMLKVPVIYAVGQDDIFGYHGETQKGFSTLHLRNSLHHHEPPHTNPHHFSPVTNTNQHFFGGSIFSNKNSQYKRDPRDKVNTFGNGNKFHNPGFFDTQKRFANNMFGEKQQDFGVNHGPERKHRRGEKENFGFGHEHGGFFDRYNNGFREKKQGREENLYNPIGTHKKYHGRYYRNLFP